jgi:hypothetical protein
MKVGESGWLFNTMKLVFQEAREAGEPGKPGWVSGFRLKFFSGVVGRLGLPVAGKVD